VLAVTYVLVLAGRIGELNVTTPGSRPGGTTYLLVGSDSRAFVDSQQDRVVFGVSRTGAARADVLLAIRIEDDGRPPIVLSIPRDLLVIAADGRLKRLALEYLGGPQQLVDTLCRSLGLGIDHVLVIDIEGVRDVIDAVGGVDVTIPRLRWDAVLRFPLAPGTTHLDGDGAVAYVRSRHLLERNPHTKRWEPVATADRGRRARAVLESVLRSAKPSLLDPIGTHRLVWALTGAIDADDGVGLTELRDLAGALGGVRADTPELPAETNDATQIPFAKLTSGAAGVLHDLGANGPGCRTASLPEAREP
jgi:LCP family protein required for cell wall assembly